MFAPLVPTFEVSKYVSPKSSKSSLYIDVNSRSRVKKNVNSLPDCFINSVKYPSLRTFHTMLKKKLK